MLANCNRGINFRLEQSGEKAQTETLAQSIHFVRYSKRAAHSQGVRNKEPASHFTVVKLRVSEHSLDKRKEAGATPAATTIFPVAYTPCRMNPMGDAIAGRARGGCHHRYHGKPNRRKRQRGEIRSSLLGKTFHIRACSKAGDNLSKRSWKSSILLPDGIFHGVRPQGRDALKMRPSLRLRRPGLHHFFHCRVV